MDRKVFLKTLAAVPVGAATLKLSELSRLTDSLAPSGRMPAVFIGHGSPENAILDNPFTQSLVDLGKILPRPEAILVISAHWLTRGSFVSVNPAPKTIYDFGNFGEELYRLKYEPKGSPETAKMVMDAVHTGTVGQDSQMGLDHGAWTVLRHIYPEADIPTLQLSINWGQSTAWHYQLASELQKLREKGILIIGSGNITHNLRQLSFSDMNAAPVDWALEFDSKIRENLNKSDYTALVEYEKWGQLSGIAHPTNDHYLPLLYTAGLAHEKDEIHYTYEGFHYGSISMRSFVLK